MYKQSEDLERLVQILGKLPGLGVRSGRRVMLHLMKHKETLLHNLITSLQHVAEKLRICSVCGNLDTEEVCYICRDPKRDAAKICVVETVADIWALEKAGSFEGYYHVLGGLLSAQSGTLPQNLTIGSLAQRLEKGATVPPQEVILALSATTEGMTTIHYLTKILSPYPIVISSIAHGVPIGGELDYLDEGTLRAALSARRVYENKA